MEADRQVAFLDAARFKDEAAGLTVYQDQQQLVSWLKSRVDSSASAALTQSLTGSLGAGRLVADTAIKDAAAALAQPEADPVAAVQSGEEAALTATVEAGGDTLAGAPAVTIPAGRTAALRDLASAEKAFALGDDALVKALPVAASVHHGLAWRHAYHALGQLGITYAGDRDADGLTDVLELRLGASPLLADSDGDGLSDVFEATQLLTSTLPSQRDTDRNGVGDATEDPDADRLTNLDEQRLGSDPLTSDGDDDGADDRSEREGGTDPRRADSDGDALLDGVERRLGLDPRRADTDSDGQRDDAEQVRAEADGPDGIEVTLVGTGDLLSSFDVRRLDGAPAAASVPGIVGPAYDFTLSPDAYDGFAQAELALPYDQSSSRVSNPADLRVFYLDPQLGWRPATDDQVVDEAARVVRATVDHFSTYAIFDIRNWEQTWTASTNPCRSRAGTSGSDVVLLDLSLVLDSSGSMTWNDPSNLRLSAAKTFVDSLLPEDRAAVVDFDFDADVLQGLTADKTAVKTAIDRIDSAGGTNIGSGLSAANQLLVGNGDPDRARMIILLTDGMNDPWWLRSYLNSLTVQAAQTSAQHAITVYTIGLGASLDEALLRQVATTTGGTYTHVASADELPQVFRRLSEETGQDPGVGQDTDGDGLDDCTELRGMRDNWGTVHVTDPTKRDTDGDGLTDDVEVGEQVDYSDAYNRFAADYYRRLAETGVATWRMLAAPDVADTDGDGLDDLGELDVEADPWWADSDGDGLRDGVEVQEHFSAVLSTDGDGDRYDDAYEVAHAAEGFDPTVYDPKVSRSSYARDFAVGLILGDFHQMDSLAWLAGYLSASGSSVIPVIGWVTGTLADVRDTVANLLRGEWVGAGLSGMSLFPIVGDATAIPLKAAKFVAKHPSRLDEVIRLIAKSSELSDGIKTAALKALLLGKYGQLQAVGFSDDAIRRLAKGDRTHLAKIAEVSRSALHVPASSLPAWQGVAVGYLRNGTEGRTLVGEVYGAGIDDLEVLLRMDPPLIASGRRFVDVMEDGPAGRIAHEAKVGNDPRSEGLTQCRKDGALKRQKKVVDVHWHFMAYSSANSIGADPAVLDCLLAEGITFTFHAPTV